MSGPGGARIIITTGTESHDNPFLADGELSKKAEDIVRHSTISRTELKIYDPDREPTTPPAEDCPDGPALEEPLVAAQAAPDQAAPPPDSRRPNDIPVKQNGQVEDALTPQSVEVEVGKANAAQPEPQKAEEVKVKDKKCKCCVVQ